jgi:hypothetical protein
MGRKISLLCAIGLVLAGVYFAYIVLAESHRIQLAGQMFTASLLMIGIGVLWLLDLVWWRGR